MSDNITQPTLGRVVWYVTENDELHRADVCHVNEDGTINLSVNDLKGRQYTVQDVYMSQGKASDASPGSACWMPYQQKKHAEEAK